VIADASVLQGSLPERALRLVRTWHPLHQSDLDEAWVTAKANHAPGTIEPLPWRSHAPLRRLWPPFLVGDLHGAPAPSAATATSRVAVVGPVAARRTIA
jgi:hypothetical protein